MKRICFLVLCLFCISPLFGQDIQIPETKTDSLLTRIDKAVTSLSHGLREGGVGRFKVYPTSNLYNSLKLDTATGKVWALQIAVGDSKNRMEYSITDAVVADETVIGRFELYPTKNNFNFILLDTLLGFAYQVQWSTNQEECGRWMIW